MSDEGMSGEMLERYARGEASVPIPTFTRDVYRHLLARLDAAERERDALREALGMAAFRLDTAAPYQNTTEQTVTVREWAKAARAALTANHSAPVVEE
jgi:hypothetical protein